MISSKVLQSLLQINADNIKCHQAFYISYKDILKDFRQCGKSDDEAYARYVKAKEKELRKLHLLEKNQRALLQELELSYEMEEYQRLCEVADEYIYLNWD